MDRVQKAVVISLIATSAVAWIASIDQPDMMIAMTTYDPLAISLFTASWTAGMAAMMFPAITPMVLTYNRLVINSENSRGTQRSVTIQKEEEQEGKKTPSFPSLRVILFVGCYLLVWALTGIALLLGWSIVMNNTIMTTANTGSIQYLYGVLLIIAGAYQFTPLKRICIGYCESPISFFMRRWRDGTPGAVKMGLYHGMYCLGCCWAYFVLMVALGWMNLLWMGLFAGIIFGEKMWSKGIWVARTVGIGLAIAGVLVAGGILPSTVLSVPSMIDVEHNTDDMTMTIDSNVNDNNNGMVTNDLSPEASTNISDNSITSSGASDVSDRMTSGNNDHSRDSMDNDSGNKQTEMMDIE